MWNARNAGSGNVRSVPTTDGVSVVGAVLVILLGPANPATAACPPLTPGKSFMEVLIRNVPGPGPVTDGQIMELVQKGLLFPLEVSPPRGPAPLTVEIRWWAYPVENPLRVEFDVDGNGVPEWSQQGFQSESGQRGYTYRREGEYQFTASIHDRAGQVTVYTASVTVLTPAGFDAELQARWMTFKAALSKRDITAALECIHSESRSRYRDALTALFSQFPQEVDRILTTIRFVRHYRTQAIYESFRTDAAGTRSFEVRFQVDGDGVWRLRSF